MNAESGALQLSLSSALAAASGCPWIVRVFDHVPSTMDPARELAGSPSPALVMALAQTEGRGRQGRSWSAAAGAFAGTFVFTSARPPASFAGFSLAAGVAVARCCTTFGVPVALKWPNDVVTPDLGKLGGILIELLGASGGGSTLLVGIGINVSRIPEGVADAAALGEIAVAAIPLGDFAARLGGAMWAVWHEFTKTGLAGILEEWRARSALTGREVSIEVGAEEVTGRCCGVDDAGNLVLESATGRRAFSAGHIVAIDGRRR